MTSVAQGSGVKKVLVVDDDVDILGMVATMLQGHGFKVLQASNGEEALSIVRSASPDLVLLDIMMPRMNGFEVLREVLRIAPGTRVVMITAFGDLDTYMDAMELGATDYVNKPFETAELLRVVRKVSAA